MSWGHTFHRSKGIVLANGSRTYVGSHSRIFHNSQYLCVRPPPPKPIERVCQAILMEAPCQPDAGQCGDGSCSSRAPQDGSSLQPHRRPDANDGAEERKPLEGAHEVGRVVVTPGGARQAGEEHEAYGRREPE